MINEATLENLKENIIITEDKLRGVTQQLITAQGDLTKKGLVYQYNFCVRMDREFKVVEVRARTLLGAVKAAMRASLIDLESKFVTVRRVDV